MTSTEITYEHVKKPKRDKKTKKRLKKTKKRTKIKMQNVYLYKSAIVAGFKS